MIKRLHIAVLRSLPLPFVAAFLTLMFLLLLQFLIRYLPELVGRGLPFVALVELIALSLSYMVTLAVPMAWLIALLVAFGRLSESRAYAVVKSAGVSLPRLAWPVFVAGLGLAAAMGYFNNVALPEANYRMAGLWRDIRMSQPAFALEPGVYYTGLQGYAIRAEAIPPDSSGWLLGVTVFDEGQDRTSPVTLVAARARLGTDAGGRRLVLLLEDGEVHRRLRPRGGQPERYERLAFRRHRLALDLSTLGFERRAEGDELRGDRTMRSSAMLAVVDSIRLGIHARNDSLRTTLGRLGRPTAPDTLTTIAVADDRATPTNSLLEGLLPAPLARRANDTPAPPGPPLGLNHRSLDGLDPGERAAVYALAADRARQVQSAAQSTDDVARFERQRADRYLVEVYKKNSMALACLVFVLVGIPLGLSVARVGVGLVAVLAVVTFLFYWVTLVQGEKLADRGLLVPEVGMWAATVVVGFFGLYLFIRETTDPAWRDPIRRMATLFQRKRG